MPIKTTLVNSKTEKGFWESPLYAATKLSGTVSIKGIAQACEEFAVTRDAQTHCIGFCDDHWQWKLEIGDTIKLWLVVTMTQEEINKKRRDGLYAFEATIQIGSMITQRRTPIPREFTISANVWGWPDFLTQEAVTNATRPGDTDIAELKYVIKYFPTAQKALSPKPASSKQLTSLLFDDPSSADVQFILRHLPTGNRKLRCIHAHSKIISHFSAYFKAMLESGFSEGTYGSSQESTPDDISHVIDELDSDNECDEDDGIPSARDPDDGFAINGDPPTENASGFFQTPCYKVVKVTETAHRTYRAFMRYLYTGSICFAPLSSTYSVERALALAKDSETPFISREQYNLANATHSPGDISDSKFIWTSPKSMYKFVIIDMLELKQISLEHIEDSLTPENVMKEILSAFASTYDEVYESELRYLKSHWMEVRKSPGFADLIKSLNPNQDSHASKVLLSIFDAMTVA